MTEVSEQVDAAGIVPSRGRLADFVELTKPRLNALVLLTTFAGYFLASGVGMDLVRLFHTLVGTFVVAGSAAVMNQVMERENDSRMGRTRLRPMPAGRVEPAEALAFGVLLGLVGLVQLGLAANLATAALGLISWLVYVLIYTPMKTRSAWNTAVGAVSGALPPMMGWVAVTGTFDAGAWALFAVLFLWQLPHFFALSWRYREEYRLGGFSMLSSQDANGLRSGLLMAASALALLPVGASLALLGVTGRIYLVGSLVLGLFFSWRCLQFVWTRSDQAARRAFLASLMYLTVLLVLMMVDKQT